MGRDESSGVVIFTIWNSPDFSGSGRNSDDAQDPAGKAWILYSVFGRKSVDSFNGFRPFLTGMQWNWREITGKIQRNPVPNTVAVFRWFPGWIRWISCWIPARNTISFRCYSRAMDLKGSRLGSSIRHTASTSEFFRPFPAGNTPEPAGIDRKMLRFRQVPAGSGGRNHRPGS